MPGRSAYLLSSLTLLTVVACAPKSPAESASDTDTETSDSTGDSSSGEPTTGEPDPTGGPDTTGEPPPDSCQAPDPAAKASISLDLGDWPLVPETYPDRQEVAAECSVQSATSNGGVIDLALLCTQGELVDMPIAVHVDGPVDFAVDLVAGDGVQLAAMWEGDGIDYVGGIWFTMHDKGGELLLAGLEYHSAGAPQDALAPLTVLAVDGACEPTCENGCSDPEWDQVERLALGFAHKDGPSVDVLDEGRADLLATGRRYDIVVGRAENWSCLNCGTNYRWIVRAADQE